MKPKNLILLAMTMLAVWAAGRAARRAGAELSGYAQLTAALWTVLAMSLQLNSPQNTAKTRAVEERLNALVPVVFPNTGGTINGNVNVNGTHTANQVLAGGVSSGASVAGTNNHFTGSTQTDGNHTVGGQVASGSVNVGGSGSGATVAVNGNVHASSTGQFDGGVVTGNVNSNGGSTNEFSGGIHSAGIGQFDGGISASNYHPGQGTPGGYPIAHGTPWENQIIDFLNSMVAKLQNAGIY